MKTTTLIQGVSTHRTGEVLDVNESRAVAVSRIFKGGSLVACGAGVFLAGALLPHTAISYIGLVVGGIALAGWGALTAGRAASHLRRFGNARSSYALVATTGLGGSIATFALTHLLLVMGVEPVARALHNLSMVSVVGFAAMLLVLVARTVLLLITNPQDETLGDSA